MADRPLRIALLTNPGSGRNRKGLERVRRFARNCPGLVHREAANPAEIASALAELIAQEPALLAVNGGDGTVAAVLTSLYRDVSATPPPPLALLRGGTTNMTAGDLGLTEPLPRALAGLQRLAESPPAKLPLVQRPILRVELWPGGDAHYGLFFGAGAIVRGIEYCHAKVHSKGLRDGIAPGICTLRVLLAMARRDQRYVEAVPIGIRARDRDGASPPGLGEQDYYLLLASPLERLFLGLRPYWGAERGAFYFSALRSAPVRPLLTLPPLFWGRAGALATPANGYHSQKLDQLELDLDGPITLDGEIYQASRARGPVRVSAEDQALFLKPG